MNDERFMKQAIEICKKGIAEDQTPFGACIIKDGVVLACAHNTVFKDMDITRHAEMNAIREACQKLGSIDLSGSVIYSTTEPCPMCFCAIHWANIKKIVYGTNIADAKSFGFHELEVSNTHLKEIGHSEVEIVGEYKREDCLDLFKTWKKGHNSKTY